jgi:hypothetical protein
LICRDGCLAEGVAGVPAARARRSSVEQRGGFGDQLPLGVPVVADRGEDEPCRAGFGVGCEPLGGLGRVGVEQGMQPTAIWAVSGSRRAPSATRWGVVTEENQPAPWRTARRSAARELPPIRIGGTSAPGESVIDAPDGTSTVSPRISPGRSASASSVRRPRSA